MPSGASSTWYVRYASAIQKDPNTLGGRGSGVRVRRFSDLVGEKEIDVRACMFGGGVWVRVCGCGCVGATPFLRCPSTTLLLQREPNPRGVPLSPYLWCVCAAEPVGKGLPKVKTCGRVPAK